MKKSTLIYSSLLLAAMISCGKSNKTENSTENEVQEEQVVKNEDPKEEYRIEDGRIMPVNGRPMMVDFYADWCPPCRQLKPIFSAMKDKYHRDVDFVTINVDSLPQLAAAYGVQNIPTILYLSHDGKVLDKKIGFQSKDDLTQGIVAYFGLQP